MSAAIWSTTSRVSPRGGITLRKAAGEVSAEDVDLDTGAFLGCMVII
jgi:hypothetical protein